MKLPLSTLLSIFTATALSLNALAESKPEEEFSDHKILDEIIKDGYYNNNKCDSYIYNLPLIQKDALTRSMEISIIQDTILYLSGDYDTLIKRNESELNQRGLLSNELRNTKEELKEYPDQSFNFKDSKYSLQISKEAENSFLSILNSYKNDKDQSYNIIKNLFCNLAATANGTGTQSKYIEKFRAYVKQRPQSSRIGHFRVSTDKFTVSTKVGTGNKYFEPKQWDDSRFLIINASFKNLDSESRLPVEGSLFINYEGKDYEFDATEPILLDGYNIWLKQINPLITMKTKIVYRIPNEIHGEVFWRPGRNPNDTRLWLGFIEAAK